jgi:hypothetical protein
VDPGFVGELSGALMHSQENVLRQVVDVGFIRDALREETPELG